MEKINPYELIERLCLHAAQPETVLNAAAKLGYYWECLEESVVGLCSWFNKRQDERCLRPNCAGVRPLELAPPRVWKHVRWYNGLTLCGSPMSELREEDTVVFENHQLSTCEVCQCRVETYKKE